MELQKAKDYYQRIKHLRCQKITCKICGVVLSKQNFLQHQRSKRHLTALAKLSSGPESGPQYEQQLRDLLDAHKVTCEVCGEKYTKGSIYMHNMGKRHLAALAKFNQSNASSSSEP